MLQQLNSGPYELVNVNPGDPGAGTPYASGLGDNSRRLLIQAEWVLTTDANAGLRLPLIYVTPSAGVNRILGIAGNTQTINLIFLWTFRTYQHNQVNSPGGSYTTVNSAAINPLHWLEPGDQWGFDQLNMQAGDTMGNIHYSYLREINPRV